MRLKVCAVYDILNSVQALRLAGDITIRCGKTSKHKTGEKRNYTSPSSRQLCNFQLVR